MEINNDKQPPKKETQEFIVETPVYIDETIIKQDGKTYTRRYERGKFLGKGGFAKCYEIKCLESKKNFAAKLFPKKEMQNPKSKKKLINEIKLHKKLHHPNIVKIEHFFEDNENVYILLELCPNQTLNDLLKRRKRITELEAQYYIIQMISALKYIHRHKIIHRDLKLGNCFLSANMEPKIGDFGLSAKLEFEGQKRKTICGTPNYIAPEILEKNGHSYEVDVWSLGVVFYTLVFGRPPFETDDVKLTYKKIKMNSFTFPDFVIVHPATKKLISKIFQLDPAKRPSFDQILEHEFFKLFTSIPKSLPTLTLACPPSVKFLNPFLKNDLNFNMQHMLKSVLKHNSISCMEDLNKDVSNDILNKNISGTMVFKTIDYNNVNMPPNHRKCDSGINLATVNIEKNLLNTINLEDNLGEKLKTMLKNNINSRNVPNSSSTNTTNNINEYLNMLISRNGDFALKEEAKLLKTNSINNNIVNNNYYINLGSLNSLELNLDKNLLETLNTNRESNLGNNNQLFKEVVKIHKFYDYSNKFGIVYFLNNNNLGVCFHDLSNMIRISNQKKNISIYIEKDGKNERIIDDEMFDNNKNKKESKEFLKKLDIFGKVLNKFQNELKIEERIAFGDNKSSVFVKKFMKTQQAILFRFSNKLIQIFFSDKTELILSTKGINMAFYRNKNNEETSELIENIMNSDNEDLIKKIRFAKNLLINFLKPK